MRGLGDGAGNRSGGGSGDGLALVSIMVVCFVNMGFTAVSPAMDRISAHFDGLDVTWVSTLPTIFIMVGTVIAGAVLGKRISFRSLAILSSAIALVSGCAPALFDNYAWLLVCRAVFGLGLGLLKPIANSLIMGCYEGDRRSRYLGFGTLFMNLGGMVFQLLGGALADVSWNLAFWGHGLYAVALVMSLFLREPPAATAAASGTGAREKMSRRVFLPAAFAGLFQLLGYVVMVNLSTVFAERGIGTAAVASTALSLYTVAGCVAGFSFGWTFRRTKRVTLALAFLIAAVGGLLIWVDTSSYFVPAVGCACIGFGLSTLLPALFEWAGSVTPRSTVAGAMATVLAVQYVGAFLCSYWLMACESLFGDRVYTPFLVQAIVFALVAAFFLIYCPFPREKAQDRRPPSP